MKWEGAEGGCNRPREGGKLKNRGRVRTEHGCCGDERRTIRSRVGMVLVVVAHICAETGLTNIDFLNFPLPPEADFGIFLWGGIVLGHELV